jgi:hypothetical protein
MTDEKMTLQSKDTCLLTTRCPVFRRRDSHLGFRMELETIISSSLCTRFRPWKRSAKASADARSEGSAGARHGGMRS